MIRKTFASDDLVSDAGHLLDAAGMLVDFTGLPGTDGISSSPRASNASLDSPEIAQCTRPALGHLILREQAHTSRKKRMQRAYLAKMRRKPRPVLDRSIGSSCCD